MITVNINQNESNDLMPHEQACVNWFNKYIGKPDYPERQEAAKSDLIALILQHGFEKVLQTGMIKIEKDANGGSRVVAGVIEPPVWARRQ